MMRRLGMPMVSRQYSLGGVKYRYGFNGKENDNEIKGDGNQQDYGMRIYDPRVGRFLSTDPLTKEYPWYTPYQFAGNIPTKFIDLDGAEPANNPHAPGNKEIVAMKTVETIRLEAMENHINENLFSRGIWTGEKLKGKYSYSLNGNYITDNTDPVPANTLNLFVKSGTTFNVDESNASKFNNYEAFVVNTLMDNFIKGEGPENYNFPTNGIISSKFLNSDIFKAAYNEFKSGALAPNQTRQYSFGLGDLGSDIFRTGTIFSITGFAGSGTITFIPSAEGVYARIFNITSLSSGSLTKIPSDVSTYPRSYVRDSEKTTKYGNISQTFNLFIPNSVPSKKN